MENYEASNRAAYRDATDATNARASSAGLLTKEVFEKKHWSRSGRIHRKMLTSFFKNRIDCSPDETVLVLSLRELGRLRCYSGIDDSSMFEALAGIELS
jgi:hypothetical protein